MQTLVGKKLVDISIIGKNEKAEEVFKSILFSFEGGKTLRIDPWDKENVFSFLDERRDEASSQNLLNNSEAITGLPQSSGSEIGGYYA